MPKMKQSASNKHAYSAYSKENRQEKNKIARMERALKAQPNNTQLSKALDKALDKGIKYTRNRKSNGHMCKGLSNILGFINNKPNDFMIKSKLPLHYYFGSTTVYASTPTNGSSMCTQLEALGYEKKKYVRKHKKTSR